MDFAVWLYVHSAKEECEAANGKDSSSDYLYVIFHWSKIIRFFVGQKSPKIIPKTGDLTLAAEDEF